MSRVGDFFLIPEWTQSDRDAVAKALNRLESIALDLGQHIADQGSISDLRAGPIRINATGMKAFASGLETIRLDADGDVFFGSNLSSPATTSFVVFSNAQTYNSESMGAGDVLLGDNSTGKANLLWDLSGGDLIFRSGTTPKAIITNDEFPNITFQRGTGTELARFGAIAVAGNDASAYVMSNAYYDGANWNLDSTTANGSIYNASSGTVAHQFRYLPSGANPRTPVILLELYNDGSGLQWNPGLGDHNAQFGGDTDANLLVLDASTDRVGMGTNAPATKLHVVATTDAQAKFIVESTAASSGAAGASFGAFSNDGAAVASADLLGAFGFGGHDGTNPRQDGCAILGVAAGNWGSSDHRATMGFYTVPASSTTLTQALLIQADQTLKLSSANSWTANGTGTVTISNLAPAGVGTATISKWLTITDNAGVVMYIPAFT